MPQDVAPTPSPTRATDRGLRLVVAVAEHPEGLALADAARSVDLSPSTALRQLRSLEAAGFAERRVDGAWMPGPELLRIAHALCRSATLPRLAQPVLTELATLTGETAYFAEPVDRATATYAASCPGTHALRHVSWLGQRVPRRGTAVGSALAGRVDADGAVVRDDAVEAGITAVSAPVRDAESHIVAALSVVGPSYRMREDIVTTRAVVATRAAALSRLIGGTGSTGRA